MSHLSIELRILRIIILYLSNGHSNKIIIEILSIKQIKTFFTKLYATHL